MAHILVICTANICRSPLVEAFIQSELKKFGFDDWAVSSAGTWAAEVRPAARMSRQIARERGLDIEAHRARMVSDDILQTSDLVLCMTESHKEAIAFEFAAHQEKVYLLSELVGKRYDIGDPYGGPDAGYYEMADETERLVRKGMVRLVELAEAAAVA